MTRVPPDRVRDEHIAAVDRAEAAMTPLQRLVKSARALADAADAMGYSVNSSMCDREILDVMEALKPFETPDIRKSLNAAGDLGAWADVIEQNARNMSKRLASMKKPVRKPPQEVRDAQWNLDRAVVRGLSDDVIVELTRVRDEAKRKHGWED